MSSTAKRQFCMMQQNSQQSHDQCVSQTDKHPLLRIPFAVYACSKHAIRHTEIESIVMADNQIPRVEYHAGGTNEPASPGGCTLPLSPPVWPLFVSSEGPSFQAAPSRKKNETLWLNRPSAQLSKTPNCYQYSQWGCWISWA